MAYNNLLFALYMGDNIFGFGSERWCAELFIIAMITFKNLLLMYDLKGIEDCKKVANFQDWV